MSDKMEAWGIEGETPQEGEWPKRDAVPFVPEGLATVEPGSIEETLMLVAGHKALNEIMGHSLSSYALLAAYRAMAARAPVELVSIGELAAVRERDALKYDLKVAHEDIETYAKALTRAAADIDVRDARIAELTAVSDGGAHDYHGPLGAPDERGRRLPIPDPVHEQFHRTVGDGLAGKVMPEARRQMQEALKDAPKEKAPFPKVLSFGDPRRVGG